MNKLYVIPTPIGNLNDLTLRSIKILKNVKYLLCENTKITGKIKKHLNLDLKLISLHKFNEISRINEIKLLLKESDVALVSDAGTPTISDPGQILIKELKNDVEIIPLPGPNSITTALSGSGLEFSSFSFIGFLEKEENKIISKIKQHIYSEVIVAYESPNRINKTLSFILKNFGDIQVVIARELTKIYEEIVRDKISNLIKNTFKGEIVLLIPTKEINLIDDYKIHINKLIEVGLDDKSIIHYLTSTTKFKKNDIYNYLKTIK
ncbi:MAG: 16S rRNA (cytidine(1402)-2'-O)-methyltransferase [Mycoplasmataceae bacterium]|nr:16S rRNA (cytidine(1402)-2'-O)-methyltransferase [Mycoplasmataceae bacterium]